MEEHEAVARLQHGDIGGLALLVERYQVKAVRVAYLVTRDLALADDVMQAAFLKAYERIGQFDAARPFGPWFLKIVLNDARKAAMQRERLVPLMSEDVDRPGIEDHLADSRPGPEGVWERNETAGELWAALGTLTPAQRAAIVQRYYLGFSEAEMSAALTCPPSTVKWRLHAARARLRTLLRPTTTDSEAL